ncbi:NAD(P)/FAD-dependent oxidoreductase [Hutsoniella sourekii]
MNLYDITIIGAGPVGLFTAFYAGLRQAKVKIIDSLEEIGGQPAHLYPEKLIYDIPAYPQISGWDLGQQLLTQLDRFDPTICLGQEVTSLEKLSGEEGDYFHLKAGQEDHYSRAVIIAAGNGAFSPRKLKIKHADQYESGNLHYYVNNIEQFKDKTVAICGGGDSAVDWALTLEDLASKVYLIHRRDKFRAVESSVQQLMDSSVEILTPYTPEDLIGQDGKIDRLLLKKARAEETLEIEVDDFIVNYGFTSSIGEIRHWGLELDRGAIKVNQKLETSMAGVYAVGDIANYDGKVKIIASGFGEAPQAVNNALVYIDPDNVQPTMHSTSLF